MEEDIIYHKDKSLLTSFIKDISATRSNPIYFQDTQMSTAPIGLSLTTVKVISDRIIVFKGIDYTNRNTIPEIMVAKCNSFWILDHSNIKDRCCYTWVIDGLYNGNLRVVCDGSYEPELTDKDIAAA